MKYHINGAKLGRKYATLIHAESGDDQLGFLTSLLKSAFSIAGPSGGPIMWHRHFGQNEMSDSEARSLIVEVDRGSYLAYEIHAGEYRQRKLGIEILEFKCDCGSDEPVFVLNETLFRITHGFSSEEFLSKLGARPWAARIKGARVKGAQRGSEHLN